MPLEVEVTEYIARFYVLCLAVENEDDMRFIEANSIALLSNKLEPVDAPSRMWLGRNSPDEVIRKSGLWNVDYVTDDYDPAVIDLLKELILNHT